MLDDHALRDLVDPSGFWRLIANLPRQARDARELGQVCPLPDDFTRPRRVVILGMGGSAIGGDVVATVAEHLGPIPAEVVRDYAAPPVGEGALLVACSFSGNTEEVIAAFSAQLEGPGMRLALTTGGALAAIAEAHDVPLIAYDFDGPPRTALGYSVLPLLEVLRRLGAVTLDDASIERALGGLERRAEAWGPQQPAASNAAKQIALRLRDRLPYVVGGDVLAVAARRWAGQLAENAKQWAFAGALPEADHSTIVALERRQKAAQALHAVLLDGPAMDARNRRRAQLTARELGAAGVDHEIVAIEARDPLGAVLEACQLGDWVSYYVALLHGVDPLPTPILDRVKAAMADAVADAVVEAPSS